MKKEGDEIRADTTPLVDQRSSGLQMNHATTESGMNINEIAERLTADPATKIQAVRQQLESEFYDKLLKMKAKMEREADDIYSNLKPLLGEGRAQ